MTRSDPDPRSSSETPSWLVEPCPPWCARDHLESDHDEDRYHQSEASIVPVVAGPGDSVPITASLDDVDLVVRVGRHLSEPRAWVAIEAADRPEPRLVLTVESARSVARHLDEQLRQVRDD